MEGCADEVLVRRVADLGDERAISELYDRYGGLIYGAGVRYLGDRALAEDLVQDVFFAVWRNAAGFDPGKASFSTWVHRITRNRATDLARRRRARVRTVAPMHEVDALLEGSDDFEEEALRGFDVVGALSELSPEHRKILVLAYFGGLSQREISARLDTPLGTIKSRTTAALRAARARLGTRPGARPAEPRGWIEETLERSTAGSGTRCSAPTCSAPWIPTRSARSSGA